jgi:hypothetical protein
MRLRPAFISVVFSFAALALLPAARSQLACALKLDISQQPLSEYSQRGTLLLYSSWVMAMGGWESLLCCKGLERSSSWAIVALLGLFVYLNVAV